MKTVVIGQQGQLARCLYDAVPSGHQVEFLSSQQCDVGQWPSLEKAIASQDQVGLLINASAYTAVDQAEDAPGEAYRINAHGVENLARIASKYSIPLIHVSTDYVFSGANAVPYTEEDGLSPLGVYGASKAAGEYLLQLLCPASIILRTSWVYSAYGKNFVKTMLALGREKTELSVVNDQWGCPTAASDLARVIWQLSAAIRDGHHAWGVYHYCSMGETSWFGFAQAIFLEAEKQGYPLALRQITPIETHAYPTPAKRPTYSVLSTEKIQRVYHVLPEAWQTHLPSVIQKIIEQ